jgi:L-ascorbate metabolism protein UlaG (beta-lactamase superfamily)
VSDHFDGRRFFNPNGAPAGKGVLALLRWKTLGGGRVPWPKTIPDPPQPPPPERVAEGEVAATFVGHDTWLLRCAAGVLTDPVWSDHAGPFGRFGPRRVRPPALPFERLPPVDVVLVSHSHYDHMDLPTLRRLDRAFGPHVVTTLGNERFLRQHGLRAVTELDWWQSATPRAGLTVTLTPAQHFAARTPFDRNRTLWGGFFLSAGPVAVYFAGDTGYDGTIFRAVRERLGPPDWALVPIGAYEPRWFMKDAHVNPDESVRVHRDVGARQSVGMHFGTFPLTDEAMDEPPRRLADALRREGIEPEQFHVPAAGETVRVRTGGYRVGS